MPNIASILKSRNRKEVRAKIETLKNALIAHRTRRIRSCFANANVLDTVLLRVAKMPRMRATAPVRVNRSRSLPRIASW